MSDPTAVTAGVHALIGLAYLGVGVLILMDLSSGWRARGFSPFGAGIGAVALTCGPHHLDHAAHLLAGSSGTATGLDLLTAVVAIPAGLSFVLLRLEAARGGQGDRLIAGTPGWVAALPVAGGVYAGALAVHGADVVTTAPLALSGQVVLSGLLAVVYLVIGWLHVRALVRRAAEVGGWSLSGLSLAGIFLTCAPMHGVVATAVATGRYPPDAHLLVVNTLGVLAGAYYLWAVWASYRDVVPDWHRDPHLERTGTPAMRP